MLFNAIGGSKVNSFKLQVLQFHVISWYLVVFDGIGGSKVDESSL